MALNHNQQLIVLTVRLILSIGILAIKTHTNSQVLKYQGNPEYFQIILVYQSCLTITDIVQKVNSRIYKSRQQPICSSVKSSLFIKPSLFNALTAVTLLILTRVCIVDKTLMVGGSKIHTFTTKFFWVSLFGFRFLRCYYLLSK